MRMFFVGVFVFYAGFSGFVFAYNWDHFEPQIIRWASELPLCSENISVICWDR